MSAGMEAYPFEQECELYHARALAALPLIYPRPHYASEKEACAHLAEQLHAVNFKYGRVSRQKNRSRISPGHVKRHVTGSLVQWALQMKSTTISTGFMRNNTKEHVEAPTDETQAEHPAAETQHGVVTSNASNTDAFSLKSVQNQVADFLYSEATAQDKNLAKANFALNSSPVCTQHAHGEPMTTLSQDTEHKANSSSQKPEPNLFTSAAREAMVQVALKVIQCNNSYHSALALSIDIGKQLKSNKDYAWPQFSDTGRVDVRAAIISGVRAILTKEVIIEKEPTQPGGYDSSPPATAFPASVPQKRRRPSGSSSDHALQRLKSIAATMQNSASPPQVPHSSQIYPREQASTQAGVGWQMHAESVATSGSIHLVSSPQASSSVASNPPRAQIASDTVLNCAQPVAPQATTSEDPTPVLLADGKFKCPISLCKQQSYQLEKACIRHIRHAHHDAWD